MQKKNTATKVVASIIGGLLIGGLAGGLVFDDSDKVADLNAQIQVLENTPLPAAEIIEVPVDSENLEVVLDNLYVNQNSLGYLELLTDDLDDDEVEQIVDRIIFINEVASIAVNAIEKLDIADELDDFDTVHTSNLSLNEDDIERIKVQDDADKIAIADIDFDDKDATVTVKVEFEQKDVEYEAEFEVEFKDGEVEDIEVSSIIKLDE